jgi:CO/xanthine dehydrogenase FAD-binding subunit
MSGEALWLKPATLDEALAGLGQNRTIVGGGAALASESFPQVMGELALDLSALGLDTRDGPVIGAMATLQGLLDDADFVAGWPGIAAALRAIAGLEVRSAATIGGSVAARMATSDVLPALCAQGAGVDVLEADGTRHARPLPEYLADPREALILAVDLGPRRTGAYRRVGGRMGFSPLLASVAGVVDDGELRLWAGGATALPVPLDLDRLPDESLLRADEYASAWYRRRLLKTLVADVVADLRGRLT